MKEILDILQLNGIEYSEDDWKEIRKQREGLPWYKQSGMKGARH